MLSSGRNPELTPDGTVVERVLRNGKRIFAHGFKLSLVRRCLEPGVSVAGLALEHGVNANLLRKWITKHQGELREPARPALLPVTIESEQPTGALASTDDPLPPSPRSRPSGCIEIDAFGARITLRGEIDAQQLRVVFDALARRR